MNLEFEALDLENCEGSETVEGRSATCDIGAVSSMDILLVCLLLFRRKYQMTAAGKRRRAIIPMMPPTTAPTLVPLSFSRADELEPGEEMLESVVFAVEAEPCISI